MRNLSPLDFGAVKHAIRANPEHVAQCLGIPPHLFNGKAQPSPIYGGRDCFQYNPRKQLFSDRKHPNGGGDMVELFTCLTGLSFVPLMRHIADTLGMTNTGNTPTFASPNTAPAPCPRDYRKAITAWRERLSNPSLALPCHQSRVALNYAISRSVNAVTISNLRTNSVYGVHSLAYHHKGAKGKSSFLGCHPAVVGVLRNNNGQPVAIQRIYLGADGVGKAAIIDPADALAFLPSKKIVKLADSYAGAAVKVGGDDGNRVAVCEGIETAWAALELAGLPTYAAINAGNLAQFKPPKGTQQVVVYADHDKVGLQAADSLYHRLAAKGIACEVLYPPTGGHDALDFLRGVKNAPV